MVTGGATLNATNLDIETAGNSSAAIRSDRGGGNLNVNGGKYVTNGLGSPAIYSTAEIVVDSAELISNNSEAVVVEGKNSVSITNSSLTGNMTKSHNGTTDYLKCIMLYQSMSGDADEGEASFTAKDSSITSLSGDMFYVTNTSAKISLENVGFTLATDVFLRVSGNDSGWGEEGNNGGEADVALKNETIEGNIIVDDISSLDISMESSTYTGAINSENSSGEINVTLSSDSVWNLSGDSYITSFDGSYDNVNTNGYSLYVDGKKVK